MLGYSNELGFLLKIVPRYHSQELSELKWLSAYSAILEWRFHLNSSSFSITLNLLSAAEASKSESVVELLLETFDDKEGDFLFLFHLERLFLLLYFSISSESELENVLCLLFLDFLFI